MDLEAEAMAAIEAYRTFLTSPAFDRPISAGIDLAIDLPV